MVFEVERTPSHRAEGSYRRRMGLQGRSERESDSSAKARLLVVQSPHSGDCMASCTSQNNGRITDARRGAENNRVMWITHMKIRRESYHGFSRIKGKGSQKAWNWHWCHLMGFHKSQNTGHQRAELPLQIWRQMAWWGHRKTLSERSLLGVDCHSAERIRGIVRSYNIAKWQFGSAKSSSQ